MEAWPIANSADEMYDALMVAGYILESEFSEGWKALVGELGPRAVKKGEAWLAHERENDAPLELAASRLEVLGPVRESEFDSACLLALESQGRILRGRFTPGLGEIEWCDRRLLARIHRYTISRLRAEIEPVAAGDFLRFLAHWQHVAAEDAVRGTEGVLAIVEQLEGFELPAIAWEHDVLPARVAGYGAEQLDQLCYGGRVAWGRLSAGSKAPLKTSPIALMLRSNLSLPVGGGPGRGSDDSSLTSEAAAVHEVLAKRGASFFHEIVAASGLLPALAERALAELAGTGLVTADGFAGLRALLARQDKRRDLVQAAGRWSLLPIDGSPSIDSVARTLLKRYGIVLRSLLPRESNLPPWRELVRVYRTLEARGEIRGGRFVAGFGGEQFAAPDAVGRLRAVRKSEKTGERVVIGAADPLNLVGILTPESRVPAVHTNRLLLEDGLPIAALEGGEVRRLAATRLGDEELRSLLARRSLRHSLQPHLRMATAREEKALASRTVH